IPEGTMSTRVTGFEDWFPTLLDLAGASNVVTNDLDGISFAPTLLGIEQTDRPFLYREYHGTGGQQSVRVGDWKLVRRHLLGTATAPPRPTTELYHLSTDPSAIQNDAASNPGIVAQLVKLAATKHQPSNEFHIPF